MNEDRELEVGVSEENPRAQKRWMRPTVEVLGVDETELSGNGLGPDSGVYS